MSHQVIGDRSFMWVKHICQLAPPSSATCANFSCTLSLSSTCSGSLRSSAPHSLNNILKLHCKGDWIPILIVTYLSSTTSSLTKFCKSLTTSEGDWIELCSTSFFFFFFVSFQYPPHMNFLLCWYLDLLHDGCEVGCIMFNVGVPSGGISGDGKSSCTGVALRWWIKAPQRSAPRERLSNSRAAEGLTFLRFRSKL